MGPVTDSILEEKEIAASPQVGKKTCPGPDYIHLVEGRPNPRCLSDKMGFGPLCASFQLHCAHPNSKMGVYNSPYALSEAAASSFKHWYWQSDTGKWWVQFEISSPYLEWSVRVRWDFNN